MNRLFITILGGMLTLFPLVASAQQQAIKVMAEVDCDSLPVGPSRTDCYVGLSRISRQKVEISAGVAQQIKSSARYCQVTGQAINIKKHSLKRK
jgi:hypothetical protein